jgi:hypothetical protein
MLMRVYRYGMEESEGAECIICLTDPKEVRVQLLPRYFCLTPLPFLCAYQVALLPCRHLSVCSGCFSQIERCPVCRSTFSGYLCKQQSAAAIDSSSGNA